MQDNVTNTRALRDFSVENVQRRITDNIAYTNARSVVEPKMAEFSKAIIELKKLHKVNKSINYVFITNEKSEKISIMFFLYNQ